MTEGNGANGPLCGLSSPWCGPSLIYLEKVAGVRFKVGGFAPRPVSFKDSQCRWDGARPGRGRHLLRLLTCASAPGCPRPLNRCIASFIFHDTDVFSATRTQLRLPASGKIALAPFSGCSWAHRYSSAGQNGAKLALGVG